jgi:hypothetical protein
MASMFNQLPHPGDIRSISTCRPRRLIRQSSTREAFAQIRNVHLNSGPMGGGTTGVPPGERTSELKVNPQTGMNIRPFSPSPQGGQTHRRDDQQRRADPAENSTVWRRDGWWTGCSPLRTGSISSVWPSAPNALPKNDIEISVFPHLTDQDLKELGVSLGHRRKMLAAIAEPTSRVSGPRFTILIGR